MIDKSKKIKEFFVAIIVFCFWSVDVLAYDQGTKICNYKAEDKTQLKLTLYGLGEAISYNASLVLYDSNKNIVFEIDNAQDYIYNYNSDFKTKFALHNHLTYIGSRIGNGETELLESNNNEACPSDIFKITYTKKNKTEYMFWVCNGYNEELNVETCESAEKYIEDNNAFGDNPLIKKLEYTNSTGYNNVGKLDKTETNIDEVYENVLEKEKEVCDENSDNYNEEECEQVQQEKEILEDEAEGNLGLDLSTITADPGEEKYYTDDSCNSLLGDPDDKNYLAYWIQWSLNVLKYIAIIALLVLSSLDFIKAITSGDKDALKKASMSLIKRFALVVLIFFLPIVIEVLMKLFGAYGTCDIG